MPRKLTGFLALAMEQAAARVARQRAAGLVSKLRGELPLRARDQDFAAALRGPGAIITEVKRASPSKGPIAPGRDAVAQATAYERGGAVAISVLTEEQWFQGSLTDLADVARAVALPVLRKDFMLDPYDFEVATLCGADAVLLIAACFEPLELCDLVDEARGRGLCPLIETHSAAEIDQAQDTQATVIGVNARNLQTLAVDPAHAIELIGRIAPANVRVLESGIKTRADVEQATAAGANAVLVGETLMRAADPEKALRELRCGRG